jgi:hypothetical protein
MNFLRTAYILWKMKILIQKSKVVAMKRYEKEDVLMHIFLTSALVGGGWSPSHPRERAPNTHWIGG